MAHGIDQNWYSDDVATFGDRLEAARVAAGLSVVQLAQRLGVREATIAAWEADEWEPRSNRMQMLAGMLNVSLVWLMTGQGEGLRLQDAVTGLPAARAALVHLATLRVQMQSLAKKMELAERRLAESLAETLAETLDEIKA